MCVWLRLQLMMVIMGWGEKVMVQPSIVKEGIEFLKPILIGMKIIDNEVIWSKMYARTLDYARKGVLMASISAIDVAVWDFKGKITEFTS